MSFDKFRVTQSSFERYYDTFLQNSMRGRKYKIVLTTGESAVGVPMSGSFANPRDPNVAFSFSTPDGQYRIPFSALREATPVGMVVPATVRTVAPDTAAAGDFVVLLSERDAERAVLCEGEVQLSGLLEHSSQFVDGAPAGYYKFLSVQGRDLHVRGIKRNGPSELIVSVLP